MSSVGGKTSLTRNELDYLRGSGGEAILQSVEEMISRLKLKPNTQSGESANRRRQNVLHRGRVLMSSDFNAIERSMIEKVHKADERRQDILRERASHMKYLSSTNIVERKAKLIEEQKRISIIQKTSGKLEAAANRKDEQNRIVRERMRIMSDTSNQMNRANTILEKKVHAVLKKSQNKLEEAAERRERLMQNVSEKMQKFTDVDDQVTKAQRLQSAREELLRDKLQSKNERVQRILEEQQKQSIQAMMIRDAQGREFSKSEANRLATLQKAQQLVEQQRQAAVAQTTGVLEVAARRREELLESKRTQLRAKNELSGLARKKAHQLEEEKRKQLEHKLKEKTFKAEIVQKLVQDYMRGGIDVSDLVGRSVSGSVYKGDGKSVASAASSPRRTARELSSDPDMHYNTHNELRESASSAAMAVVRIMEDMELQNKRKEEQNIIEEEDGEDDYEDNNFNKPVSAVVKIPNIPCVISTPNAGTKLRPHPSETESTKIKSSARILSAGTEISRRHSIDIFEDE